MTKNVRPIEEVIEQLDTFTNLKRCCVAGTVSEPTMYKHFLEFIKYLNSRDIFYEILTNGNTHDAEWWTELGKIVADHCRITFTICGSTQELHEKYRVGSNLNQILEHAQAYRSSGKKNDFVQYIIFQYNQEDFNSQATKDIIAQFSNSVVVESDGVKGPEDFIDKFPSNVLPRDSRDKTIRNLYKVRPTPGKADYEIDCISLREKTLYMNQFGQISACSVHAEYEQDYFEGDEFNYKDIKDFKYPSCYMCEKKISKFIEKFELPVPMDAIGGIGQHYVKKQS
jgi:MoaA/NifB/PqqE/SkfB family radical SAM enzyme